MMSSMRPLLLLSFLPFALWGCGPSQPQWCQARSSLDASCTGPQCVAAVVVDYKRLEPRGYRIYSLDGAPVDRKKAEAKAVEYVQKVRQAKPPDQVDSNLDDDFYSCFLRYNDTNTSWLVIVHAPTGQVLFAGEEVWADAEHRGYDFPLPEGFLDSAPLGCSDGAQEPEKKKYLTTGVPFGTPPASTAEDAWSVVRRLNLTEQFTAGQNYHVLVVSYAPAEGEFDSESADWYVWIYRV